MSRMKLPSGRIFLLLHVLWVFASVSANDVEDRPLQRAWKVVGPPTLLLSGPDGVERRGERTIGKVGADEFLQRLWRDMGVAG